MSSDLRKLLVVALGVIAAGSTTWAQEPPATGADEIVVPGHRLEQMAIEFAGAVAIAPAAEDQYARWNFSFCPSVAGLAPDAAQTLIDQIARRAHAVEVEVEPPGCSPNLVIVFAPDSDRFARQVVDERRDLLGYYSDDDVITAGRAGLEQFASTPRAVRWWHVSNTVTADGRPLSNTSTRTGRGTLDAAAGARGDPAAASIGNGFNGLEATRSSGSRTRRNTRQDLSFALVIVDSQRIAGAPLEAVADYLAMASLAQLDPEADTLAFPTILNLFRLREDGREAPSAMTEWDLAYLQGLYSATREAVNSRAQRAEIARRIVREVETQ